MVQWFPARHTENKMDGKTVYDKIFSIHDQTISMLRSLHIPPYPDQYKKYFDQLISEQADDALKKALSKGDDSDEKHAHITKYIDIANRSLSAFVETHADITEAVHLQEHYLHDSPSAESQCTGLVEGIGAISKRMSDELERARSRINELSDEFQHALTELTIDPLTKVTNRKGLNDDLAKAIEAGQNKQLPMVLMMIDADRFKQLNDTYGHLAGDKVLYFLAQSIKSIIRSGDSVYRYGGEEFVVVLNRCDRNQAYAVADKIRSKIEHSHLIYSGKTIHMTVSIGVTLHQQGDTFEEIVSRADTALYQAKEGGRNQTVIND